MPVIQIELKAAGVEIAQAFNQVLRYKMMVAMTACLDIYKCLLYQTVWTPDILQITMKY